ncbi:hypothetical protein [Actinacidiphila glaucinigra]|uniref:hypothetical protein n=1 Tax=Actinacidiphila glaucinigra TaxID=235986 RepID=UPI003F4B24FB
MDAVRDLWADPLTAKPAPPAAAVEDADPFGEDLQLALHVCYELHYRGFAGVHPGWEWDPGLLVLRGGGERALGIRATALLDGRLEEHLLGAWRAGRASLRAGRGSPRRSVRPDRTGKVHLRRLGQRVAVASRPPSRPEQGGRAMRSAPLGTVGTARRAAAGATVR